ncbi:2-oxo-4-hydroxy-4-carboxy-5-ureidoimidazoline decarboxylase [Streptomyces sp. NPDC015220]|uniref:2-oxo-4-hydroxy-4-carboxy-5-ureidoimidazoline decarboxylase n=1 Tax=Streptomyces sp. NPDC015220 TaxID=3364947 RepID=UPI0036F90034
MPRRGPTLPAQTLEHFNTAAPDAARLTLLTCLHSPRWAHRLTAHRPYPNLPALLAAADEATYDLEPGDLAAALAAEPLPALPEGTYAAASMALTAASAAYAAKFGHTFVICLEGAAPDEILDRVLAAIRSRLTNDPEDERVVAREELRCLAGARLRRLVRGRGAALTSGSATPLDQRGRARARQPAGPVGAATGTGWAPAPR